MKNFRFSAQKNYLIRQKKEHFNRLLRSEQVKVSYMLLPIQFFYRSHPFFLIKVIPFKLSRIINIFVSECNYIIETKIQNY